jgi:hypothetical protein
VFNGRELTGMVDAMVERGLRLRRGLEEIMDVCEAEREEKGGMSESGDEIEEDAKELRRLLPY